MNTRVNRMHRGRCIHTDVSRRRWDGNREQRDGERGGEGKERETTGTRGWRSRGVGLWRMSRLRNYLMNAARIRVLVLPHARRRMIAPGPGREEYPHGADTRTISRGYVRSRSHRDTKRSLPLKLAALRNYPSAHPRARDI